MWSVGFYRFSSAQLPNFQGKSPGIFPLLTPRRGTFGFQKGQKPYFKRVLPLFSNPT
ncbi:Mobile element protein [Microcystis panniformis FACHB-1757]|uniref:Mobile element protein n=1 Tax=Microcystis panniformis FACHB-1757 TaxID=1638788 RepID=A0A0K1SAJ9_9CHRO|nr:Mobile element protein [Microcystis panniformis FACHB-1757]